MKKITLGLMALAIVFSGFACTGPVSKHEYTEREIEAGWGIAKAISGATISDDKKQKLEPYKEVLEDSYEILKSGKDVK